MISNPEFTVTILVNAKELGNDTNRKSYGLSNGAILNGLKRPQTNTLRSRHSLPLNISETAEDTAIVPIKSEYETVPKL